MNNWESKRVNDKLVEKFGTRIIELVLLAPNA